MVWQNSNVASVLPTLLTAALETAQVEDSANRAWTPEPRKLRDMQCAFVQAVVSVLSTGN